MNDSPQITCVVPARNEGGHLPHLLSEILSVEKITEIIIVEGGSTDNTWSVATEMHIARPDKIRIMQQSGKGKFNAVLEGAAQAQGRLILIWDADGTVSLQDTEKIITRAINTHQPVIGNRLKGNMEKGAMRKANYIGNWLFAVLWSPILASGPKDMLCGTKIFHKETFTTLPPWLIHADPYGDFALVAFARFQKHKIDSVAVDYYARKYGTTNIRRWSGGITLLKCTLKIYFWLLLGGRQ